MKNTDIIKLAQSWIGKNEHDGSHKEIIDIYNTQRPLPRGYAVKYTDAWCATMISALAVKLKCTNIIPTECSCPQMISLFQKMGCWDENDARVPNPGDIIFYDWDDSGAGDDRGSSEHVGLVESIENGYITVIEGNYHDAVGRRQVKINGRYIRGYGVPKYDSIAPVVPTEYNFTNFVTDVQKAIGANIDGQPGPNTLAHTITISRYKNNSHAVVYPLQKWLKKQNFYKGEIDGMAGPAFEQAVKNYQSSKGTNPDGEITAKQITWKNLLQLNSSSNYTKEQFIREVQEATGAKVDGVYGPDTLSHTITVKGNYMRHKVVEPLQKRLIMLGYNEVGEVDGCAGPNFTKAVKHFQKDHGKNTDGVITAKQITWQKLLTL